MSYGVSQSEGRRSRAVWRTLLYLSPDGSRDVGGSNHLLQSLPVLGGARSVPICDVSINLLKVASKNKCIPFLDVFTGVEMCDVHDSFL